MSGVPKLVAGFSLWKGGAILAAIITVVLAGFLAKTTYDKNKIEEQRVELQKRIEDPVTGYIARLRTSENNVVTLKAAIIKQNTVYREQSVAAGKELNRLRGELKLAQAERASLQARVNGLLGKPIKGNTLEERVTDVDKQVLEDLKK